MRVSKYNASGNDFVIFHTFAGGDRAELARTLCHRHSGVGADGLIVLKPGGENRVIWEFYNSDGSEAKMCGNGARAAAKYAVDNGLCEANLKLLTASGEVGAVVGDEAVQIELTVPKILADTPILRASKQWYFIDTGVPHLLCFCEDLGEFDADLARELRREFNANVNYAKIISPTHLKVRTFERGVEGETLACGTGMAACFYAGVLHCGVRESAKVYPKSGEELGLGLAGGKILFSGKVQKCFDAFVQMK